MKYILQKGYIRTCTNYFRVLAENNFNAKVITAAKHDDREGVYKDMESYMGIVEEQRGWPHNLDPAKVRELYENGQFKYVVCIKNPYSWFHSVGKTGPSVHRPDPSNPWQVIDNFNDRYRAWMDIIESNPDDCFVVRHEDLCNSFEETMQGLADKFDLERTYDSFANERRDVLGQSQGQKRIGNTFYGQSFNAKGMPLSYNGKPALDQPTYDRVRSKVDWSVAGFYGYGEYDIDYQKAYDV